MDHFLRKPPLYPAELRDRVILLADFSEHPDFAPILPCFASLAAPLLQEIRASIQAAEAERE